MILSLLDFESHGIIPGDRVLDDGSTMEQFSCAPRCLAGGAHLSLAEHQLQVCVFQASSGILKP